MTGCLSGCSICEGGNLITNRGTDHCYQKLSEVLGETDGCDKIPGTGFVGQNPPKDKCYLQVADKTNDPKPCDKIVGGMNSYTQDECYQNVGAKGGSANDCDGLSGSAQTDCRTGVARGRSSEGKPADCGTGFSWVAGGLGGGSCMKAAVEPTTPTTKDTAKPTTPTTKEPTTKEPIVPTTKEPTTKEPTTTKPTTTKETTPTTKDTKDIPVVPTDKDTKDKKEDTRPWWEKLIDKVSGTTKTIDETAAAAGDKLQSAADKAQAAANKVKEVFTGVDKTKNPTADEEKKSRLSSTLDGVEDKDMRDAITKEFIKEKQKRQDMNKEDQKKLLEDIKSKHEENGRLDDIANTLKKNTYDKAAKAVGDKIDSATEAATEAAKEKLKKMGTGWIDKNAPPSVKDKLEKAQEAYEKVNEKMEKVNEKLEKIGNTIEKAKGYYDKAKETYTAVKETTDKINKINEKVTSGAIDPGRARVLKGGVLLGKGLEKATSYIPVFGDTASTVTKETFGVVIKVGTEKAERSVKMGNCFDDPANCDTDGISGY